MADVTVVLVDLQGYSDIQRALEQSFGVAQALAFDRQIQGFIADALAAAGVAASSAILARTGDGGLLRFDRPDPALAFAAALHRLAAGHNQSVTEALARRVFRIGIATGELAFDPETGAPSGMTISRAARLEAAARPGGVLIDTDSHAAASGEAVAAYRGPEIVTGKRDERFEAWRAQIDITAPPAAGPNPPARGVLLDRIAADFRRLRPVQVDDLMRRLDIDRDRRPPDVLTAERRKSAILDWADEEQRLADLARDLRAIVGTPE